MIQVPIDHFIVRFKDGTVKKIIVGEGEGYFKEEFFKGALESFTTHEVFVAKGTETTIQNGKK